MSAQHEDLVASLMDSIRNDVTQQDGAHSGGTLSSLCIALNNMLSCVARLGNSTQGRLVSFNSVKSGLPVGVC